MLSKVEKPRTHNTQEDSTYSDWGVCVRVCVWGGHVQRKGCWKLQAVELWATCMLPFYLLSTVSTQNLSHLRTRCDLLSQLPRSLLSCSRCPPSAGSHPGSRLWNLRSRPKSFLAPYLPHPSRSVMRSGKSFSCQKASTASPEIHLPGAPTALQYLNVRSWRDGGR